MSEHPGEERADTEKNDTESSSPKIIQIVCSLRDPTNRRPFIWRLVKSLLVFTAIFYVVFSPAAIGQILAIGIRSAIIQYGRDWLFVPLYGPVFISGLASIIYILELFFWSLKVGLQWVFGRSYHLLESAAGPVLGLGFIGFLIWCLGMAFYDEALERTSPPLKDADQKTIAETRQATAKHQEAIKKFSETAQTLLADLDRTALKVADAKREITGAMVLFDRQMEATQTAQANLSRLAEKQRAIQDRAEELDRLLQGKRLITQEDYERSARDNLWQGILMGVLTSLVATFLYPRLGRLMNLFLRKQPS